MKRHYKNVKSIDDVTYFVGPEVEHTKMYGVTTLFKVGDRPLDEILEYIEKAKKETGIDIRHIYFTANHSFKEIQDWNVLHHLLHLDYYVTVDGLLDDINKVRSFDNYNEKLIIIVSLPILNAEDKKNMYIKIDTDVFGLDNPGVWCTPLKNMINFQDINNFTPWSEYKKDIILK